MFAYLMCQNFVDKLYYRLEIATCCEAYSKGHLFHLHNKISVRDIFVSSYELL